jgi:hypothetical protein
MNCGLLLCKKSFLRGNRLQLRLPALCQTGDRSMTTKRLNSSIPSYICVSRSSIQHVSLYSFNSGSAPTKVLRLPCLGHRLAPLSAASPHLAARAPMRPLSTAMCGCTHPAHLTHRSLKIDMIFTGPVGSLSWEPQIKKRKT